MILFFNMIGGSTHHSLVLRGTSNQRGSISHFHLPMQRETLTCSGNLSNYICTDWFVGLSTFSAMRLVEQYLLYLLLFFFLFFFTQICKDKVQSDYWILGLRAVISRCHSPLDCLRSCRRVQSCVNSPAGVFRKKQTLGLLDEATEYSQVLNPFTLCQFPNLSCLQLFKFRRHLKAI